MPNKETIIEDRIQMSNEEAIYTLKNMAFLDVERDHEKTEEAIGMAISALEEIDRIKAERDFTDAVHTAIYTIDYIHQLTAERDRFKAERDAAIKDLFTLKDNPYACYCDICKNLGKDICDRCLASAEIDLPFWEWRGEQNDGRPG